MIHGPHYPILHHMMVRKLLFITPLVQKVYLSMSAGGKTSLTVPRPYSHIFLDKLFCH